MITFDRLTIEGNELKLAVHTDELHKIVDVRLCTNENFQGTNILPDRSIMGYIMDKGYRYSNSINVSIPLFVIQECTDINSLQDNIVYVYVVEASHDDLDIPDGPTDFIVGAVFDLAPIYQSLMNSIKCLNNKCDAPMSFIDRYMHYKAIELSLECGQYDLVNSLWNKFYSNKTKHCEHGCY